MKYCWIILLSFISIFTHAQTKKWTLEECVLHAFKNNISIQQATLDTEISKADDWTAIGNFLPDISGDANYNKNTGASINPVTNQFENESYNSFSGRINSGITIFNGLRNWKILQRTKFNKLASQYSLDKMKDDIALMIANNYLQILLHKEQSKVLKNQLSITKDNLKRTQDLIEAGSVPAGDIYELQATAATQEQQIITAENNEIITKIALCQLLQITDYQSFDIVDSNFEIPLSKITNETPENIIAKAKEHRNELKIAAQQLKIAETDVKIARSSYYPTLSGFMGYNARWSDNIPFNFTKQLYTFDGTGIGLQLNVPVFNGFQTRTNVKKSKLALEKQKLAFKQTTYDLEKNIYQAYTDLQNAKKTFDAATKTAEARKLAYNFAKERFDVGMMNSFDFSQATMTFENANSDVLRAKYDYIFKIKILELYFGIKLY